MTPAERTECVRLYRLGLTRDQLASVYGRGETTIRNLLRRIKDNGGEWRDFDLQILGGRMVQHRLGKQYMRGRPQWIVRIEPPVDGPVSEPGGAATP